MSASNNERMEMEPADLPDCEPTAAIEPMERWFVPHRKRLSLSYVVDDRGARELRIDYGLKTITFDDERLFGFGEQLAIEASFTGQQATTWGPGYRWDELQPLFEELLAEGIIERGDGAVDSCSTGPVSSPLPASACPVARSWSLAECEAITLDLANRAVELGYIEAVVPVVRIAHPALDADDRQVGEANVYPSRLRLERETAWRVCQYAGSRYRDKTPMNVTALKAMIKHWKPMMATLLEVRAELRARIGPSRDHWTIGELHVLSFVVLALPAFWLLTEGGASPQRPLHPVLSSLFRITDGIRMTVHEMLFSIEHTRRADEAMTAAGLHAHAERHSLLIGETGVCAGPSHLIDELLTTVIDGAPVEERGQPELPAEVRELMSRLPAAVDYGLLGMQAWAVSHSVWLAMSRAYQAVLAVLAVEPAASDPDWTRLHARLRADWCSLETMQIALDHDWAVHLAAYADGYERARRISRSPVGRPTLVQAIAPREDRREHRAAADLLRVILGARCARSERADAGPGRAIERIVDALLRYLREEQAVLAAATELQDAINSLLDRPRPERALSVRDLHVNYSMGKGIGAFPYLFDSLEDELGVRVECSANTIAISDRWASPSPTCDAGISVGGQ